MIKIGHPYLEERDGLYWINCVIHENEEVKKVVWGRLSENYKFTIN